MRRWLLLALAVTVATVAAFAVLAEEPPPTEGAHVGPPAGDPCGEPVLKPNGTPWRCAFADDFEGDTLDGDRWQPLVAVAGARRHECRVADNVAVEAGVLRLSAVRLPEPVTCPLTAGGVTTGRRFAQVYGRVEIRAALPDYKGPGFHSALWMYPQAEAYGPWPASGEIDIAEYRTGLHGRAVPTVHWRPSGRYHRQTAWNCVVPQPEEYHSYVLEWSGAGMRFVYDGRLCLVVPFDPRVGPRPFDRPFFLILNQSHGIGGNQPDADTPAEATMYVDSVRVWR